MAKIGVLGGTFDPIHNGHLRIGTGAYREFGLESIWFMPSGIPPHKRDHRVTVGEMRWDMVKLAVADTPYFLCSDFEMRREGETYTAQTLALLREAYREHEFYFIVGADSLYEIEQWHHPNLVMKHTVILAAGRTYRSWHRSFESQIRYLTEKYKAMIYPLHIPEIDISSKEIRRAVAEGRSIRNYVPAAVADYIIDHRLYRDSE